MFVFDPNIFDTDKPNFDNDKLIRTLYHWTCHKKSRLPGFTITWDEDGILEEKYNRFIGPNDKGTNSLTPPLINYMLSYYSGLTPVAQLPKMIEQIVDQCDDIYKVMISMALSEPHLIVVLSDTAITVSVEIRQRLCQILGREAILYVSEFNQRLFVRTEGKTDWKHLKSALLRYKQVGSYLGICVDFDEFEDEHQPTKVNPHKGGDETLFAFCCHTATTPCVPPVICIFDADDQTMVNNVSDSNNLPGAYKDWGNDLYSFALPTPNHRKHMHGDICIEFYYVDGDLHQCDSNGRRLYLNTEFSTISGRHNSLPHLIGRGPFTKKGNQIFIFSGKVHDLDDSNVALSKDDFASYIMQLEPQFSCFDISAFDLIFEIITNIKNQIVWEY